MVFWGLMQDVEPAACGASGCMYLNLGYLYLELSIFMSFMNSFVSVRRFNKDFTY